MDAGEPRNWKWMVPVFCLACLLIAQVWATKNQAELAGYCLIGTVPVAVMLAAQSAAMFWAYYSQVMTDQFVARRRALADTAEGRLFESARMMHPEAVRLLLLHRRMVWRIKETPIDELIDWVLDADPRVHVRFVEYVLRNSNPYALMEKRRLSDKAHTFDSEKLVTDYEQYDAFVAVLQRRSMLTQAFGSQAGQWIEPWNPELAARRFGIVDLFEEEDPTPSPSPNAKDAFGEGSKNNIDGGLKSAIQQ